MTRKAKEKENRRKARKEKAKRKGDGKKSEKGEHGKNTGKNEEREKCAICWRNHSTQECWYNAKGQGKQSKDGTSGKGRGNIQSVSDENTSTAPTSVGPSVSHAGIPAGNGASLKSGIRHVYDRKRVMRNVAILAQAQQNIFSSPPAAPLASLKETSYDWLARNSAPSILQDFSHMSRETRKLDTKIYRRHAS